MGVSTDAVVAYGVDLGEEIPQWVWDTFGLKDNSDEGDVDVYSLSSAAQKRGLDIIYHCSYAYPMYILAIASSERRAYRGEPEKLSLPEISDEWKKTWAQVAQAGDPTWLLFSLWG